MIDLKNIWAPQIIAYAEIILDHDVIYNCWVLGRRDFTSVTSFDEMIEQIFDDLDSEHSLDRARSSSILPKELVDAISDFLSAIKDVDAAVERAGWSDAPESILASRLWQVAIDRANSLAGAAAKVGFKALR